MDTSHEHKRKNPRWNTHRQTPTMYKRNYKPQLMGSAPNSNVGDEGFHHHQALLLTPAGRPIIQLNFDTSYLEIAKTPQVKGSVPQDCSPLPMCIPVILTNWLKMGGSHHSPLEFK